MAMETHLELSERMEMKRISLIVFILSILVTGYLGYRSLAQLDLDLIDDAWDEHGDFSEE
jgi:hypothetical protein